ncbi:MAG TPA: hypothetical protein VFI52_15350 [Gemmatimonadaceae bacterium]|nr:hypothetical protein [Gemmatimonadaceae bacterium]
MILLLALLQAAIAPDTGRASAGAQDPAWAADGRLAVGIRGDLWIRRPSVGAAQWIRVTQGPAWDREPAWSADGTSLSFTSTAGDAPQLWRVRVGAEGAIGAPERISTSRDVETEASLARDGSLAFVRGRGALARVWVRRPDGSERRLTRRDAGAERWPAWSPDGSRIA